MKIDLENDGVFQLETDQAAVRAYFDGKDIGECIYKFADILDEAQGWVGMNGKETYIVIKVKP